MALWISNHPQATIAGASAMAMGAFAWASVSPGCGIWGKVVSRGVGQSSAVALSFDDGPTAGATDDILDVLLAYQVPAAFFVVGANVRRHPYLVKRIHDEGHVVGNHSFDHSHFACFRGRRYWERQLGDTDREIEAIIGHTPAMFRPPMGFKMLNITGAAYRAHKTVVTWSRRGFDGVATTAAQIIRRTVPATGPDEILMLHDGVEPNGRRDPSATLAALPSVITGLREKGLELVRLDKLIGVEAYIRGVNRLIDETQVACHDSTGLAKV